MDKIATENLFLLEFLVDKVQLDSTVGRDVGDMMGDTCVSVQFLDNLPLDICEDDFNPKRDYKKDSDNLKSGKSCLFSLTADQAQEAVHKFDVLVQVFKKTQPGVLPEKVQVGNSLISIVNLFNELISSISSTSNNNQAPTAKTLKDTFKITNAAGQTIGDISMYIRMSCFGKLIVTQFQMNLEDKSVLFKDKEGHSLYRYKKVGSRRSSPGGFDGYGGGAGGGRPGSECPTVPCARSTPGAPSAQQFNTPCNECANMGQSEPDGCYQEIGASMGGNALTIRVHKDKNKLEQIGNDNTSNMGSCSCGPWNGGGGGGGGAGGRRGSKGGGGGSPGGAYGGGGGGPGGAYGSGGAGGGYGGGGGGGGANLNFQGDTNFSMRAGGKDGNGGVGGSPISFKMGSCQMGSGSGQGNVNVVPPVCTAPDGTQYTELSDPDKDVFVLRIGKKDEGAEKQNNLELELTTPKGPDLKPRPKKETRDAQWNEADAKEAGWKGEGANGKGAKKGKKNGNGKKKNGDQCKPAPYCVPPHFIGEPKPDCCHRAAPRCVKIQACCPAPQYYPCPPPYSAPVPCMRPVSACNIASSESCTYGSSCPTTSSCRMWC